MKFAAKISYRLPRVTLVLSFCLTATFAAEAQIQVQNPSLPLRAICGIDRKFELRLLNAGDGTAELDVHVRLYEASSSSAVPIVSRPWKRLKILAGQTIVETAELRFPDVRSETLFIAQWFGGERKIVGTTKILVYPTNVLNEVKSLAGNEPVGIFDHDNEFKPLFNRLAIEFVDLEESDSSTFGGRLAILLEPTADSKPPEYFVAKVKNLTSRGVPLLWIRAPAKQNDGLRPSFQFSKVGQGTILVAQRLLVSDLTNDPEAQLNLVRLSRFAVFPEQAHLNDFVCEP